MQFFEHFKVTCLFRQNSGFPSFFYALAYQKKDRFMEKKFSIGRLKLLFLVFGFFCFSLNGLVQWNGAASDVIDDNLEIQGDTLISSAINIRAESTDVLVALTQDVGLAGGGQLHIFADLNQTVTFVVDHVLQFSGSGDTSLLVTFSGQGTVEFVLHDDKKVILSDEAVGNGTKAFVVMDGTEQPTLRFVRNSDSDNNVEVVVGSNCILSYIARNALSDSSDEMGTIEFNPGNSTPNTGRMVLRILDGGAVYVGGSQYTGDEATQGNINLETPAGFEAKFVVKGQGDNSKHAGLLILNENETVADLLINPWMETASFTGNRYGFVLGANGSLTVCPYAYIDYVGLRNNFCPEPTIPEAITFGMDAQCLVKERNASALIVDGNPDENATPAKINLEEHSAIYFRSGVDRDGNVNETEPCQCLCDDCGEAEDICRKKTKSPGNSNFDFTVCGNLFKTPGAGELVFDVEGLLNVFGASNTGIQILSLEVEPTGGSVLIDSDEIVFPKRTCDSNCFEFKTYNKAYALFNNRMNLHDTTLVHTDQNHQVCEKNDFGSEPTYVGGDTFHLCCGIKPVIAFYNSNFYLHTPVALTGVDLLVPTISQDNLSVFKFFSNGNEIDDGSGINMILGTQVGACSCNGSNVIDNRSNIIIKSEDDDDSNTTELELKTGMNDGTIICGAPLDPQEPECCTTDHELSIHTLFLGNGSSIFVGSCTHNCCECPKIITGLDPYAFLDIQGNYFSFESSCACKCLPDCETGLGAIHVCSGGKMQIGCSFRANISTMVLKSDNGTVCLPLKNVYFDNQIGVKSWKLDLRTTNVLVPKGQKLSDYTINWLCTIKDFANFTPYEVGCFQDCCCCPEVLPKNITSLPTIKGKVDQLQVKGSRLGSAAHVMVDGGHVRELIFFGGCSSADAPVGVVVLQNCGKVGLGSAHKNIDSLGGSVVLGVNGVTIIANGEGQVNLNEDIIINNVCHILRGPDFCDSVKKRKKVYKNSDPCGGDPICQLLCEEIACDIFCNRISSWEELCRVLKEIDCRIVEEVLDCILNTLDPLPEWLDQEAIDNLMECLAETIEECTDPSPPPDEGCPEVSKCALRFYSDCCREIRVKEYGVLDLRSFTGPDDVVEFAGNVKLVLEPGAKVVLGGGVLHFADSACVLVPSICDIEEAFENAETDEVQVTDPFRVDFVGKGTVMFNDCSKLCIDTWGYVGVTTDYCDTDTTDLTFCLKDKSQFTIGRCCEKEGGVFQIGNTQETEDKFVLFTLRIDGTQASFNIGEHSFFGLGVGIVDNTPDAPNDWLVGSLFNVDKIFIDVLNGTFAHERIFPGSNPRASLLAINNPDGEKDYQFRLCFPSMSFLGGGNMFLLDPPVAKIHPVVEDEATETAGILKSKQLFGLGDVCIITLSKIRGSSLFETWKVQGVPVSGNGPFTVCSARADNRRASVAYVDDGNIQRQVIRKLIDGDTTTDLGNAWEMGVVNATLTGAVPRTVLEGMTFVFRGTAIP